MVSMIVDKICVGMKVAGYGEVTRATVTEHGRTMFTFRDGTKETFDDDMSLSVEQ